MLGCPDSRLSSRVGWKAAVLYGSVVGMNLGIDAPTGGAVSGKTVSLTCLGVCAIFFILNDILGLINDGGMFSAIAAIRAAQARMSSVDVDGASLRTLFIIFCAFLATMSCLLLRIRIENRWSQLVFIVCIIGGGSVLDAIYGPWMIDNYLSHSGYHRCDVRDHTVGSGKGRVWLNNYVLNNTECHAIP